MAAGILQKHYQENNLVGRIESAGTMDWNVGFSADARALKVCLDQGIDIRKHRARQLTNDDYTHFEALIVMDNRIEKTVRSRRPSRQCAEVIRIVDFLPGSSFTEIQDPYHDSEVAFQQTFEVLNSACSEMINRILRTGKIDV